jgi:hypothetical protein
MTVKILIALVAFPVLVHAIFLAVSFVVGLMLPEVLSHAGDWADIVTKGAMVVPFLIAIRIAFGLCRRMWPMPAVK